MADVVNTNAWDSKYQLNGGIALPSRAPAPDKSSEVSKGFSGEDSASTSEGQPSFDSQPVEIQMDPPRQAQAKAQNPAVWEKMKQESANLEKGRSKVNTFQPREYINAAETHIGDGSGVMSTVKTMLQNTYAETGQQYIDSPPEEKSESEKPARPVRKRKKRSGGLFGKITSFFEKASSDVFSSVAKELSSDENSKMNFLLSVFSKIMNILRLDEGADTVAKRKEKLKELSEHYNQLSPEEKIQFAADFRTAALELQAGVEAVDGLEGLTEEDLILIELGKELIEVTAQFDYNLDEILAYLIQSFGIEALEGEEDDDDIYVIQENARRIRHESDRLDKNHRETRATLEGQENRRIEAEENQNEQELSPLVNPLLNQQAASIPEIVPVEQVVEASNETEEPVSVLAEKNFFQVNGVSTSQPAADSTPDLDSGSVRLLSDADHADLATVFMPEDSVVLDQLLSALEEEQTGNDEEEVPFDEGLAITVKLEAWQQTQLLESESELPTFELEQAAGQQGLSVADFLSKVKDVPLIVADQQKEQQELDRMVLRSSFV